LCISHAFLLEAVTDELAKAVILEKTGAGFQHIVKDKQPLLWF
jgi:hypothetical protein